MPKDEIIKEFDKFYESMESGIIMNDKKAFINFLSSFLDRYKEEVVDEYLKTDVGKVYQDYETLKKQAKEEALKCLPEKQVVGGDLMDNDECERRRGFNSAIEQMKERIEKI